MWERDGDFETWTPKSPDFQLLTKHRVVRGAPSKLYRITGEYSRNLMLSTFCMIFRENTTMISVILQTDYVFYLNAASPIWVVSSHLAHVAIRLVPQASKEMAVQHLQRLHWEVIATASHLFSFLVIGPGNELDSEGWQDQQKLIYIFFLSVCVHTYFFFVGRICRQQITVLWGAVIS